MCGSKYSCVVFWKLKFMGWFYIASISLFLGMFFLTSAFVNCEPNVRFEWEKFAEVIVSTIFFTKIQLTHFFLLLLKNCEV